MARRTARATVPAYYADVLRWLPVMEDPGRYFATPCVNEMVALAEALRMIHEEGLPARFARHQRIGRAVRAGLEALGLTPVTAPDCRADTLSVVFYPKGVEDAPFRKEMASRGVVVAGCLGPLAGKAFRMGHMGNIGPGEVTKTLQAVEDSLRLLGVGVRPGAAVAAAAAHLAV